MSEPETTAQLRRAIIRVQTSVEGGTPDYIDLGHLDDLLELAGWAADEIDRANADRD